MVFDPMRALQAPNCVRLQLIRCGRHSGSWRRCGESFHLWFTSIEDMES